MSENKVRIAIISPDLCKPNKCKHECKKVCPINSSGKLCIEIESIAKISEELCIGCSMCVKRCPFNAIKIINLPSILNDNMITHHYGENSFRLYRLPIPRLGQVLGLVGSNGVGKSTALKILGNKLKPNLGHYRDPPDWDEILRYFRGSELQNYFLALTTNNIKAYIKPQYVDLIPKTVKGIVRDILKKKDERGILDTIIKDLNLESILDRQIEVLSGGELQRFTIATICIMNANVYMFDEPSSYLDIKQRLNAAKVIRSLSTEKNYIIVVEHDLAILDYLSDFICCLYGSPNGYGVVTFPSSVRDGINIFLDGFIPSENLRFRENELTFKFTEQLDVDNKTYHQYKYPKMTKTFLSVNNKPEFKLTIEAGEFKNSEIIVLLSENGCGKTTFIKLLAGIIKSDDEMIDNEIPKLNVSYKPQTISPKFEGTVRQLLYQKIKDTYLHPQFQSDVFKPMNIQQLLDQEVKTLSGGELQRVAIVLCLGKPADIYLIDEPSAYLDAEERIIASKVIKRFILHSKKTAFIIEHDFIMATYLADRVIVYDGIPSKDCIAKKPESLLTGMNYFLQKLGITFRRDPSNFRPRINKFESIKDREQKAAGQYFYLDN